MSPPAQPPTAYSVRQRRLFLLRARGEGQWIVAAEGMGDGQVFDNHGLAVAYAGLWASAHPPSQLVERCADGRVVTLGEYD